MGQVNLPDTADERIRKLEARVKALETAAQTRVPLDTITDGTLQVVDDQGNLFTFIGAIFPTYGDGSNQYGFLLYRQNPDKSAGTLVVSLSSTGPGVVPQTFGLWDNAGNTIWTDDGNSGQGIARPYLSFPMVPWNSALWGSTNATSWTTVLVGGPPKQQPKVFLEGAMNVPTGVTAQLRLWDAVNSVQIGSTVTVSSAPSGVTWSIGPSAIGGGHLGLLGLQLQAQITAGSGTVQVTCYTSYGQQS